MGKPAKPAAIYASKPVTGTRGKSVRDEKSLNCKAHDEDLIQERHRIALTCC